MALQAAEMQRKKQVFMIFSSFSDAVERNLSDYLLSQEFYELEHGFSRLLNLVSLMCDYSANVPAKRLQWSEAEL